MFAMLPVWASWGVMAIAVVYGARYLLPLMWAVIRRRPVPDGYAAHVLLATKLFWCAAGLGFLIWIFAVPI